MTTKFFLFSLLLLLTTLVGCSDHDDAPPPVTMLSIQLTIDTNEFPIGIEHTATAIGNFSDGSTQQGNGYIWSSDNPEIAEVDSSGNIQGLSTGSTNIKVENQGIKSSLLITITDAVAQSIEIFPGFVSVPAGVEADFQARALYSDGIYYDITNNKDINWQSSNEFAATFNENNGVASTHNPDLSDIDVSFQGLNARTPAKLTVRDIVLTELIITPVTTNTVPLGQNIRFKTTAYYSDNSAIDVTINSYWQSNDNSIISPDSPTQQHGLFNANGIGNAEISATYNGIGATSPVEVINPEFEKVVVSSAENSYPVGVSTFLHATAFFVGGLSYDISNQKNAYWQSSNLDIATVALNGKVTMISPGFVDINFTFNDITETKTIEVTTPVLTRIYIAPQSQYFVGEDHKRQLSATGFYDNGTSRELSSSKGLQWSLLLDHEEEFTEGQISADGIVHNYPTEKSISSYFHTKATMDGIEGTSTASFGATKVLTNEDNTLSFIGPFTDIDADYFLVFHQYDLVHAENGTTGPESSTFIMLTLQQATNLCDTLRYDGFDDYRLPTYEELQAVWHKYDDSNDESYDLFNNQKWAVGQSFWTIDYAEMGFHKLVNLTSGQTQLSAAPTTAHYASCVRDKPVK